MWLSSHSQSARVHHILSILDDYSPRYGNITIFKWRPSAILNLLLGRSIASSDTFYGPNIVLFFILINFVKICCISLYKEAREVTTSPIPTRHAPFPIATNFGVWDQVADVINHPNFYLNRAKGYAPEGVKIWFTLLTWCIAHYITCYTVISNSFNTPTGYSLPREAWLDAQCTQKRGMVLRSFKMASFPKNWFIAFSFYE